MAYTVLARKYRPHNFSEMVGQEHVVQALTNALDTQRLHHAYLFTGTRGVGKTTVSRILAKSLNCTGTDGQGQVTAEPCGVCDACRDIDAGRFVDYTELDAASNRGVDEVQQLLEQAVYKPVQGRYKVFMVDEVHMLTNTAFNAMLKTLEEPPEYLKFVLATTDPQKVPVTVLSRCLQFNLRPMAPQTIAHHLEHVLAQESVAFEVGALRHLSQAARGSMRDALSLTDQAIAFGHGSLQEVGVRAMLGVSDQQHVIQLIRALAQAEGADVVALVNQLREQGHPAGPTLEAMAEVLQQMAVAQLAGGSSADAGDHAAEVDELASLMPPDETQLLYSLCLQGRQEIGLAVDEYAGLVMVLLRLLAFKPQAWGEAQKKSLQQPLSNPTQSGSSAGYADQSATHQSNGSTPSTSQGAMPVASLASAASAPMSEPEPLSERSDKSDGVGPTDSVAPSAAQVSQGSAVRPPWEAPDDADQPAPSVDQGVRASPSAAKQGPQTRSASNHTEPVAAFRDAQAARVPVSSSDMAARRMPAERLDPSAISPLQELAARGIAETSERLDLKEPGRAAPAVQASAEGDFWFSVVSDLLERGTISALVRELALQSQLVARDDQVQPPHWLLRVEQASLNQPGARDRLLSALADAGHHIAISVEVGRVTDAPGRRIQEEQSRRLEHAARSLRSDPELALAFDSFGGKILTSTLIPK